MVLQYNILIRENITYIHSSHHLYKIVLSHRISLQFSIQVFTKVSNDKYSISSFVFIKYIALKNILLHTTFQNM
jgi:hypothetical protein